MTMLRKVLKKTSPQHLYFWLINAVVYNLCRLVPFRSRRIWVFGESDGKGYVDNTRYLFEYTCEHDRLTRAVWLTASRIVISEIRDQGWCAYLFYSPKGVWYALRAGIAIYNKSLGDFGKVPLVGGARLVTTWHGAGFKKIYRAAVTMQGKIGRLRNAMEKVFNWTRMDLILATSEYQKKQFLKRFDIKPDQIAITGQPRNDVLRKPIDRKTILGILGLPQDARILLYMPTYRPVTQGYDAEESIVSALMRHERLRAVLSEAGICFLIKLHPATVVSPIGAEPPFYMVPTANPVDTQQLLGVADMLVTDYSGCYVDYSLLKRPVLFYIPDEVDYIPHMEGMDKEYYEICQLCQAYTIDEVIDFIKNPKDVVSEVTNRLFVDETTLAHSFCENAYSAVYCRV